MYDTNPEIKCGQNIRYDDTVHVYWGDGEPLCGDSMIPACAPERTSDPVNCWECKAILD